MADDANEAHHPHHGDHAGGSTGGADPALGSRADLCDLLDSLWGGMGHVDVLLLAGGCTPSWLTALRAPHEEDKDLGRM